MLGAGLRVPIALDASALIFPEDAERHRDYACPECKARVFLRESARARRHFYHDPGVRCGGPGEGEIHRAAKRRIVDAVNSGRPVLLEEQCSRCEGAVRRPLPPVAQAAEEVAVAATGRVVDVGLLNDAGELRAAVEVLFSHEVDAAKRADLRRLPWVEVRAADVVPAGDGIALRVTQCGGGWKRPTHCGRCENDAFLPEIARIPGFTRYDTGRQGVLCPKTRKAESIIYTCSTCVFFINQAARADASGVWCGRGRLSPSGVPGHPTPKTWPVQWRP